MRTLLISVALLLAFAKTGLSQQAERNSSLGLYGGVTTYYGELNDKFFPNRPEWIDPFDNLGSLSWGVDLEQYLGDAWAIGLLYTNSEFTASDRKIDSDGNLLPDAENFGRALNVRTSINDLALYGQWSANDGKLLSEDAFLSPFLRAGVGLTRFRTYGDLGLGDGAFYRYQADGSVLYPDQGDNLVPVQTDNVYETELTDLTTNNESYSGYTLSLLGGVGLNFRFGDHFSLQLQSLYRPTLTDFLDDVGGEVNSTSSDFTTRFASNPSGTISGNRAESGNDSYLFHSLAARFYFGNRSETFRAPVVIVGELPLQDTSVTEQSLFTFEAPEPLEVIELTRLPVAPARPSLSTFSVPQLRARPVKEGPRWEDPDGDSEVPSIESEVPSAYSSDPYRYEYLDVPNEEDTTLAPTPPTTATVPQVVTTYPQWARDDQLLRTDSLDAASAQLRQQIAALRTTLPTQTSSPKLDSIDQADVNRQQQIDSLTQVIAALQQQGQTTDSVRIVRNDSVMLVPRVVEADPAQLRALEVQLQQLEAERRMDAQRRQEIIGQQIDARERSLEAELADIERQRALDRATIKNERKADRQANRLSERELELAAQNNSVVAALRDEQLELKRELADLRTQLAMLQSSERSTILPATPVTSTTTVSPGAALASDQNKMLAGELASLRQEMAQLRSALLQQAMRVSAPASAPAVAQPIPAAPYTPPSRPELLSAIKGAGVTRVFFATGSANLSQSARNDLADVAQVARQYPNDILIRLAGFADKTGDQAANQALSQRRVAAVESALIQLGVDRAQLRVDAYGEDFDARDLAFGRRVEVRLGL